MNRNVVPTLLLILWVAVPLRVAAAETAPSPQPKAAAKSVKGKASVSPQRLPEAPGTVQLEAPRPAPQTEDVRKYLLDSAASGSPRPAGRTTIAPFPVPFDTSRNAAERMKRLNVPRGGETTIAPIPPPAGVEGGVYFGPAPPGAAIVEPVPGVTPRPNPGEPKRLRSEAPEYPDAARKAGVQGTVWLQIHVLENGSVGEAVVIRSIPLLDDAALKAVKRWKYFPPMSHGKPTDTWVTVPVKFTLH